jgi:hypothetical protein
MNLRGVIELESRHHCASCSARISEAERKMQGNLCRVCYATMPNERTSFLFERDLDYPDNSHKLEQYQYNY